MNAKKREPVGTAKDPQEQLELAVRKRRSQKYIFRLYVSGMTPRSTRAVENIRRLCEENLKGRYELEVVDIFKNPEIARSMQVIAAPTLVKELPQPLQRFIGDLSDADKILLRLDKEK